MGKIHSQVLYGIRIDALRCALRESRVQVDQLLVPHRTKLMPVAAVKKLNLIRSNIIESKDALDIALAILKSQEGTQ